MTDDPITAEWLKEVGFKWHQFDRQPLKTYAVLPGGLNEEASLHRRFKAYRLNGEWFRRAGSLATWIEGRCK